MKLYEKFLEFTRRDYSSQVRATLIDTSYVYIFSVTEETVQYDEKEASMIVKEIILSWVIYKLKEFWD